MDRKKLRPCEGCGTMFHAPPSKAGRFCSHACYHRAMEGQRRVEPRTCERCRAPYYGPPASRYCSHRCYTDALKGSRDETRECPACARAFTTTRSNGQRYCSPACGRTARRDRVRVTCEQCRAPFETSRTNPDRFCSHPCYAASLRRGTEDPCAGCGSPVYVRPSRRGAVRRVFCSTACRARAMTGPGHPHYVHGKGGKRGGCWQRIRRGVLARDGHRCQRCGTHADGLTPEQWRMEVHHRVPFGHFQTEAEANHPDNLVTLCHRCHVEEERRNRAERRVGQTRLFA